MRTSSFWSPGLIENGVSNLYDAHINSMKQRMYFMEELASDDFVTGYTMAFLDCS